MTVMLHPTELAALAYNLQQSIKPRHLKVEWWSAQEIMIWEYWQKSRLPEKVKAWSARKANRRYAWRIPLSVAKYLHVQLQQIADDPFSLSLLAQLDAALVNLPDHERPGF